MESSERMDRTGQSSTNRFSDGDDLPPEECDLNKLMASCEKWSLKNDLQLLTHLKQMSSNLIDKSEATNQSMNNLVFNAKMHCVKVDNVINEFQMLANSQFVENRVYDEEVEDIMANGTNVQNDDTNAKPRDEDISTKIKIALSIGLSFLNDRFDCSSQSVPQNDSDDENDQILEGLISNSSRDQYSQRPLPYLIGSDEFAKDNYVGLGGPEENPIIDLNIRAQADRLSARSVESVESEADTFGVSSDLQKINHLIPVMNDMNDSEDDSTDLFGSVTQSSRPNAKTLSSESESDSEPFGKQEKPSPKSKTEENIGNESKPPITSFQDELAAVIGGRRPDQHLSDSVNENPKKDSDVNKSEPILAPTLDSESSDESDSIFNVKSKPKPKIEEKQNNFSNLFDDETNEDSLFTNEKAKPKSNVKVNEDLPKPSAHKFPVKTSSLFDDDDEDDDDIFSSALNKKKTQVNKSFVDKEIVEKPVVRRIEIKEPIEKSNMNVSAQVKPIANSNNLFDDDDDDDDEEDDDLFKEISSKPKQNSQIIHEKSETKEHDFKPTSSSVLNKPKPNTSLIGELSAALKQKQLFPSSDEESDELKSEEDMSEEKDLFETNANNAQSVKHKSLNIKQDSSDSLFDDNEIVSDVETKEVKPTKKDETKQEFVDDFNRQKASIVSKEDFLESAPTVTLSNDGLKHRAALGAQRQRRPPTKRSKIATDLSEAQGSSQQKQETQDEPRPVATARTAIQPLDKILVLKNEEISNKTKDDLSFSQTSKSIASIIKSPSTEEDDIFPTQIHTKNLNVNKISEKSENNPNSIFEDSGDDSLFSSNKINKTEDSKKVVESKGLFDTSDSDEDILSNKPSNVISNIIKTSKSNEFFNDVSSTDSSISNKSDLKASSSRPAVSLFSDSDDDDLFAAVNKNKSNDKKPDIESSPTITRIQKQIPNKSEVKTNNTLKKINSLFSDDDEDTDLFAKSEPKKETKVVQNMKNTTTSARKPVFALDDSDSDEDLFASKPSKPKTTPTVNQSKPEPKRKESDLFDDPLFASRS